MGRNVLGHDIVDFTDPHAHLPDSRHWTFSSIAQLHLEDGKYFITVQAVNNVDMGGSMVTTVGHRIPLTVDTEAPIIHDIYGVKYNETTSVLTLNYNVRYVFE